MGVVEQGCPPGFVCMTGLAAIALGHWIDDVVAIDRDDWAACGPLPATPDGGM